MQSITNFFHEENKLPGNAVISNYRDKDDWK